MEVHYLPPVTEELFASKSHSVVLMTCIKSDLLTSH